MIIKNVDVIWMKNQSSQLTQMTIEKKRCFTRRKRDIIFCSSAWLLSFFAASALANYTGVVQNSTAGYYVQFDDTTTLSGETVASDGETYYQIGPEIRLTNTPGNPYLSLVDGTTLCAGKTWGRGTNGTFVNSNRGFNRVFVYLPPAGISINGNKTYRINNNTVVVLRVSGNMDEQWSWAGLGNCSPANRRDESWGTYSTGVSGMSNQFPMFLTFYLKERAIDGTVILPSINLAGYSRAFSLQGESSPPPYAFLPINETSAPIRLRQSTLNIPANCTTVTSNGQAGTLNLRHGSLNSLNYDSEIKETVTYNCKFTSQTKVKLKLDYATDSDPQKRLPLKNSVNDSVIYSNLTMTDESSGATGKELKVNIQESLKVTIRSHLQGKLADAGEYQGSAWLIATYD